MNLTNEQYDFMLKKFPGLELYIIRCELKNELDQLERNELILNDFDKGRLEFLRYYRKDFNTF